MKLNKFILLSSYSDEELMLRVVSRDDERAFNELYIRHVRRLMGFFYVLNRNDSVWASELAKDTFEIIWTIRQTYHGVSFQSWMFEIAFRRYRYVSNQV